MERAGHTVIRAADGREALEQLFDRRPDPVLLDVGMPKLNGWQVLERIREVSDVPVLMLTAESQEVEEVRGLRQGADDFVTKPFGRQETNRYRSGIGGPGAPRTSGGNQKRVERDDPGSDTWTRMADMPTVTRHGSRAPRGRGRRRRGRLHAVVLDRPAIAPVRSARPSGGPGREPGG